MILHTVNKSVATHSAIQDCLALCAEQASILLIEDGVYNATSNTTLFTLMENHQDIQVYALKADLTARGLLDKLHPDIKVVDDSEFVNLCVSHDCVQSWY